jgi:hypothetical protein
MLNRAVAIAMLVGSVFPSAGMAGRDERRLRMDERRFWELIDQARKAAPGHGMDAADRQAAALEAGLAKLPPKEIIGFQELLDRKMVDTYRWDLWGAAYLLNGGCSDDCFDYFRGWLIGRGQKVFDAALKKPDSLAEFAANQSNTDPSEAARECESFLYVARGAYRKATGVEMPDVDRPMPREPKGTPWTEEDLPPLLPAIAAKVL